MPDSFSIKRYSEFISKNDRRLLPSGIRGVYALLKKRNVTQKHSRERYDVVYVGLSRRSTRGRLRSHAKSKRKGPLWDYFSVFEVDGSVSDKMIEDLEGILRHIYRKDSRANRINKQRKYKRLGKPIAMKEWRR